MLKNILFQESASGSKCNKTDTSKKNLPQWRCDGNLTLVFRTLSDFFRFGGALLSCEKGSFDTNPHKVFPENSGDWRVCVETIEPRKKPSYFPLYWLFNNRAPKMVCCNPHITG